MRKAFAVWFLSFSCCVSDRMAVIRSWGSCVGCERGVKDM